MGLVIQQPPADGPITLADAKAQVRVVSTAEDALIGGMVKAATQAFDDPRGWLGRCILTQKWEWMPDVFAPGGQRMILPVPLVTAIDSVQYLDPDGVVQTLDPADYYLVNEADEFNRGELVPALDKSWPEVRRVPEAVKIGFTAGWATAEAVPQPIKQAQLLTVAHWFEHRMAVSEQNLREVPLAAQALANRWRMPQGV